MRPRFNQDSLAGLLLTGIGAIFAYASSGMRLGTPMSMGPGFFPLAVSVLLIVLGIVAIIPSLKGGVPLERPQLRQVAVVSAALFVFAMMIEPFGLLPSVAVVVMISALADKRSSAKQTVLLALGACAATWFVFLVVLDMNIPAIQFDW